jgi:hypothetical protein
MRSHGEDEGQEEPLDPGEAAELRSVYALLSYCATLLGATVFIYSYATLWLVRVIYAPI